MKKVLILANSSSGLYGFRNELVLELLKEHEVHVSLPDDTNNEELVSEGCVIHHTDINRRGMNPIEDFGLIKAYQGLVKEIEPDVVLTYTIKPNVYGGWVCGRKKIPYIANITGLGSALENGGLIGKIALILYKIGLRKAKCVFLQNESNMAFFKEHKVTKAPLDLLPGSGVNLERFEVSPLPEDKDEFLFISRVMREKGIDEYIEAAHRIHEKHPDVIFSVLGQCEEAYEDILREAEERGDINYVGRVKDVRPYLKNAQAVIHPSFYPEGMSNVCLEAAASGRTVITTDRPGCRETVNNSSDIESGKSGFIVPIRDSEAVINAIESYLSLSHEEREKMGLNGRKFVEKSFDRNIIVKKYMRIIKEC